MGGEDGCEGRLEAIIRTNLCMKLLIQLVGEILHLSGKSQGKVREFQTPMAVATMHIVV